MGDDGLEVILRLSKLLANRETKENEANVDTIDIVDLVECVREGTDHKVMTNLYLSRYLRPLCSGQLSDSLILALVGGKRVLSASDLNRIWSEHRPRDAPSILAKDRIVLRDIFNSIREAVAEAGKKNNESKASAGEAKEISCDEKVSCETIPANCVLKVFDANIQVRALCAMCDWLNELASSARGILERFLYVASLVEELDFNFFIEVLHAARTAHLYNEMYPSTLDSRLIDAALCEKELNYQWPIPAFSCVTHAQVEQLAHEFNIHPETESKLVWIVKQALETPLPSDWLVVKGDNNTSTDSEANESGSIHFRNVVNGEVLDHHPATQYFTDLVNHERQQIRQLEEFGAAFANDEEPGESWMAFTFILPIQETQISDKPFKPLRYYYNFANRTARGSAPDSGTVLKDQHGVLASKVLQSFPLKQNIDRKVFSNVKKKFARDGCAARVPAPPSQVKISEITVLSFSSWWNDNALSSRDGQTKRYIDLYYHLESGNFQAVIQGVERVFTFSHLIGKYGPLEGWDLHVGAKVNILGRQTTLMKASLQTIKWLEHHERRVKKIRSALLRELAKYDNISRTRDLRVRDNASKGKTPIRAYLEDIKTLRDKLLKYRPKLAEKIVGAVWEAHVSCD